MKPHYILKQYSQPMFEIRQQVRFTLSILYITIQRQFHLYQTLQQNKCIINS